MDTSSAGNCYKFRCPYCSGTKLEKVETHQCRILSTYLDDVILLKTKDGYELKEPATVTSVPELVPGDGDENIRCATCGRILGLDIDEEASFTVPAGTYNPFVIK